MINKNINEQLIFKSEKTTVIAKYEPKNEKFKDKYQNQDQLEQMLIETLKQQGYQYEPQLKTEADLLKNLRIQIEKLNNYRFSDQEWKRFLDHHLLETTIDVISKAKMLHQGGHIVGFELDNGKWKNFKIIDKVHLYDRNRLQFISKYQGNSDQSANHHDLTILVNGLPLVQIELIKQNIDLKNAFNDIKTYETNAMKSKNGLFNYVQVFVCSNGLETKYYANTTRMNHIENLNQINYQFNKSLNYWADQENHNIKDLYGFATTFFDKHTLINLLTKYCVLNVDDELRIMRPYQISAVEKVLNLVKNCQNQNLVGSEYAKGYIWHATGSGKTLTAFKTSQLLKQIPGIDKIIHVVDRQDLDSQTIREFEKFQPKSVSTNKHTRALKIQLKSDDANNQVIVTTIQKLNHFIKTEANNKDAVFNKTIVFVFDECHRSQFGAMHQRITKSFKNHYLFGFTGTPILPISAKNTFSSIKDLANLKPDENHNYLLKTTQQLFGKCLSRYNMINAIKDQTTLPFKIDEYTKIKQKDENMDELVRDIDRQIWEAPERIRVNAKIILEQFPTKTNRQRFGKIIKNQNQHFNGILTCASINGAKKYYQILQELQKDATYKLKIAMIYSYQASELNQNQLFSDQFIGQENLEDLDQLSVDDQMSLEQAVADYNQIFKTNWDLKYGFIDYYKDVAEKMKAGVIDLLIVVNMFLTGFDAACVNTLWIDRWLQQHGLIQAISRTNRISNDLKTHGNIIAFRPIQNFINEAVDLYKTDDDDFKYIFIPTFDAIYSTGYQDPIKNKWIESYQILVEKLKNNYSLNEIENLINSDKKNKLTFMNLFSKVLKSNAYLLHHSEEFANKELLSEKETRIYLDLYCTFKNSFTTSNHKKVSIIEDIEFLQDCVRSYDIGESDFWQDQAKEIKNRDIRIIEEREILINSCFSLRSKKFLIKQFIKAIQSGQIICEEDTDLQVLFNEYKNSKRDLKINQLVNDFDLDQDLQVLVTNILYRFWDWQKFKINDLDLQKLVDSYVEQHCFFTQFDQRQEKESRLINALQQAFEELK